MYHIEQEHCSIALADDKHTINKFTCATSTMFVISPLAELTKSARSRKIGTDFGENSITIFYNAHLPYSLSLYSVIHWEVYYCFNYNSETIRRRASMRTLLLTICTTHCAKKDRQTHRFSKKRGKYK